MTIEQGNCPAICFAGFPPLMQGRFKSIPIENGAWAYELSLYVHLNPVMRKAHGLGQHEKAAEAFRERIRQAGKGGREIAGSGRLRQRVSFEALVVIVERLRDEDFKTFMARRGDWAKPLLLWALRRYSGMTPQPRKPGSPQ